MALTKDDNLNAADVAEIWGVGFVAALRGGHLTARQQRHLDRIARRADRREDKERGRG